MMSGESVFLCYIRMVLKKWTGLQLAIMEGMGGIYAREKEVWFAEEIEKYFKNNEGLASSEVEDFMAAVLDGEFDTVAEDGSLEQIANEFCKAFEMCKNGSEHEVEKLLQQLGTSSTAATSLTLSKVSEGKEEEDSVGSPLPQTMMNLTLKERSSEDESSDGWTKVQSERKRR